jgi:hypothetical protein
MHEHWPTEPLYVTRVRVIDVHNSAMWVSKSIVVLVIVLTPLPLLPPTTVPRDRPSTIEFVVISSRNSSFLVFLIFV